MTGDMHMFEERRGEASGSGWMNDLYFVTYFIPVRTFFMGECWIDRWSGEGATVHRFSGLYRLEQEGREKKKKKKQRKSVRGENERGI